MILVYLLFGWFLLVGVLKTALWFIDKLVPAHLPVDVQRSQDMAIGNIYSPPEKPDHYGAFWLRLTAKDRP